jgi:DNA-binding NtrC family response regulator
MIHIAVVDDDTQISSMLEKFLKRNENYRVSVYNNPLTALSSIDKSVDVVLLDIMMPQMNGLDFLPKIKEKYSKINVIMMTAYSTLDKVLDSHRYGAEHYLMKPFSSLDAVSKKIDEVTI